MKKILLDISCLGKSISLEVLDLWLLPVILTLVFPVYGQQPEKTQPEYKFIEIKVDSLPPLNVARSGHKVLNLDGELTVFGGHTTGFIPTPTVEYLRDGVWHTAPLFYPHDDAALLKLRSGKVLLAGGHQEPLGIGQIFPLEIYDPATHSSRVLGIMSKKRSFANAAEIAEGEVLVSGNWYAQDAIETFVDVYNPIGDNGQYLKKTSFDRSNPYIMKISPDDAIIFGSLDDKGNVHDKKSWIDRFKGPAYQDPFLNSWLPLRNIITHRSRNLFIGNEADGRYVWLLPVENIETGEVAIARVCGPEGNSSNPVFSLLSTEVPLPLSIDGKPLIYSSLVCDPERHRAYMIASDPDSRMFVASVDYSQTPSEITIYSAGPQPIMAETITPALTPEGDLVFAGGHLHSNFEPTSSVFRLPLGNAQNPSLIFEASGKEGVSSILWWILVPCLIAFIATVFALIYSKKKTSKHQAKNLTYSDKSEVYESDDENVMPKEEMLADLIMRVDQLMNEQQAYLNPDLRISEVAARIGSNRAYVSAAVNSQRGSSFSQYLAEFRIEHAKKLLREAPDRKISDVALHSGFSTDSTFFRVFRNVTGMSPKEWLASIRKNN